MEKRTVLVAMSGGVDSSVAAALLVEQGHRVIGVTMKTFCYSEAEAVAVRHLADDEATSGVELQVRRHAGTSTSSSPRASISA